MRASLWNGLATGIVRLPTIVLPVVYAVLGGAILELVSRSASLNVINSYTGLEIALLVVLVLMIYMTHTTSARIQDLHKRSKLVFEQCLTANDGLIVGKRLIESAQPGATIRSIYTLVEKYSTPNDAGLALIQQQYMDAINERLGSVNYHRLIQLSDADLRPGGRTLADLCNPSHVDHFRKAIGARSDPRHSMYTTRVDVVPARLDLTFVIVQNRDAGPGGDVLFQINEHILEGHSSPSVRMSGGFVIKDPDGQVVPYFDAWFRSLANSDRLRAVTDDDLRSTQSQSAAPNSQKMFA